MKQEKDYGQAERDRLSNEEEQLSIDELMDVQGGVENAEQSGPCGLGCYLTGIDMTENPPKRTEDGPEAS